jgi:hypothetical protein
MTTKKAPPPVRGDRDDNIGANGKQRIAGAFGPQLAKELAQALPAAVLAAEDDVSKQSLIESETDCSLKGKGFVPAEKTAIREIGMRSDCRRATRTGLKRRSGQSGRATGTKR